MCGGRVWTRRAVVGATALTVAPRRSRAGDRISHTTPTIPFVGGCCHLGHSSATGRNSDDESLRSAKNTSNVPGFDRALGEKLAWMSNVFQVSPAFQYCDDDNATSYSRGYPHKNEGLVIFGTKLLKNCLNQPDGDVAAVIVCVHEFAHQVQYDTQNLYQFLRDASRTVTKVELHADYVAGFFLGIWKIADPTLRMQQAGRLSHNLGDSDFNVPDHHGTPDERTDALEAGYALAKSGVVSIQKASAAGVKYVTQ